MKKTALCLALVGLLALSACGSSGSTSGNDGSSSPEASSTQPSKKKHEIRVESFGKDVKAAMEDAGTFTVDGTFTTSSGAEIIAHIDYDITTPDVIKSHRPRQREGQTSEEIRIGSTKYVKAPGETTWTSSTAESDRVTRLFQVPEDITVTEAGKETIDGKELVKYDLTEGGDSASYWLTEEGYIAQVSFQGETITFGNYGKPVTITEPDPSEVTQG